MKQFIVDRHTTPSTPALVQVPTEKLPIYATEAAAETDLSNLEIGQIIAINTIGTERLAYVVSENGTKRIKDLTANVGTGAPVGSYIYMEKKSSPQGYLYCDGSTFDETVYPALYQYLGTNVLPDFREFSPVGAEQNTTNVYDASTNPNGTIHDHDVYTEGQAKDDQVQDHVHNITVVGQPNPTDVQGVNWQGVNTSAPYPYFIGGVVNGRAGTVTRGKRKAVFVYIKATSGLTENQQENVLNTINENNSYSTEEHPTGKKWIDGKPIYSKVVVFSSIFVLSTTDWTIINNKLSASDLALLQSIKNIISCFINIPVNNTYMIYENLTFAIDGSNIKLQDNKGFTVQANTAMTLEYTKTTD